jgi:AraC family transcriptional regulator of adaptative response/methylated-DNA-[protein]-cysteine methyltransferase
VICSKTGCSIPYIILHLQKPFVMLLASLPADDVLYTALLNKDSSFEGVFFVGVKTTGIFCRPTCTARKPKKQNCNFFKTTKEALLYGYRPCKICEPLRMNGDYPEQVKDIIKEISLDPSLRLKATDLRKRGIQPEKLSRWFKKNMSMTFVAYQKSIRIGKAYGLIRLGESVTGAAVGSGYESLSGFTDSFKKQTGFTPTQSKNKKVISTTRIPTPLGPMMACAVQEGICLLEFADRPMLETQLRRIEHRLGGKTMPGLNPHFEQLSIELMEYFEGKRKAFLVPLVLDGSAFQENVWNALLEIPYGQTRTYQQQAVRLGNRNAIRAVAKANGDNRIAIIVPCHRVIGSDGKLTGYGGGLWRKKFLLDLEKATEGSNINR